MPIRNGRVVDWAYRVELSDIWEQDLGVRKVAAIAAERIRKLGIVSGDLENLLEELVRVDDVEGFDAVWEKIYDWADANLVWINVHKCFAPKEPTDERKD